MQFLLHLRMLFRGQVTPIATTFPLTMLAGLFMDWFRLGFFSHFAFARSVVVFVTLGCF